MTRYVGHYVWGQCKNIIAGNFYTDLKYFEVCAQNSEKKGRPFDSCRFIPIAFSVYDANTIIYDTNKIDIDVLLTQLNVV